MQTMSINIYMRGASLSHIVCRTCVNLCLWTKHAAGRRIYYSVYAATLVHDKLSRNNKHWCAQERIRRTGCVDEREREKTKRIKAFHTMQTTNMTSHIYLRIHCAMHLDTIWSRRVLSHFDCGGALEDGIMIECRYTVVGMQFLGWWYL